MTTLPTPIPSAVTAKLASLRRSVMTWLALDGATLAVIVLCVLIAADMLLDWWLRMDRSSRAICLVLALVAVGVVVWYRLVRPLTRPIDDDALAVRVESTHRSLAQSLISALQFARINDPESLGMSRDLMTAAIDQGIRESGHVDFTAAISPRYRNHKMMQATVAAVLALAILGLALLPIRGGHLGAIWLRRNVLLQEVRWPQRTYLYVLLADGSELRGSRMMMPRGDDWEQVVKVTGENPGEVVMDVQPETGGDVTQAMTRQGEIVVNGENQGQAFHGTFRNVLDEFRFRARGGDGETPWIKVTLVDRPRVNEMTLTYTPPKYTGHAPVTLAPGEGPRDVLVGGSLSIKATTNKPLNKVELFYGNVPMPSAIRLDGAAGSAMGFSGQLPADQLRAGQYAVRLFDADDLPAKRPVRFALRVVPDAKPAIRAALQGIGTIVTTRALVPVYARIKDDYAVMSAALVYQAGAASDATTRPAVITGEKSNPIDLGPSRGQDSATVAATLDLDPLKLVEGQVVALRIDATDNNPTPGTGSSAAFNLKVASDNEVRTEIERKMNEQLSELERIRKDQDDIMVDTRSVGVEVRGKNLTEAQRQTLTRAEKRQRLLKDRFDAMADQFVAIQAELRNNRLDDAGTVMDKKLTTSIIDPLRRLAKERVPLAADALDESRKVGLENAKRDEKLATAFETQKQILADIAAILKAGRRSAAYQEAITIVNDVLKVQDEVNRETIDAIKARVGNIFGDDEKPAPKK